MPFDSAVAWRFHPPLGSGCHWVSPSRWMVASLLVMGIILPPDGGHAGTVWTRDGKTYQGRLKVVEGDWLIRRNADDPIRLPLRQVWRAQFEDPEMEDPGNAGENAPPGATNRPSAPAAADPGLDPGSALPLVAGSELRIPSDAAKEEPATSWKILTVGRNVAPLRAAFDGTTLTLEYAGGALRTNLEAFGSVTRTVAGDFVFTARLNHLELHGREAEPMAGLFIQKDFRPDSPRAAFLLDSAETLWRITRSRQGAPWEISQDKLTLPLWLRLVRDGDSVRCYTSNDGYNWALEDLLGMRLPERVQVGILAGSPGLDSPASATFDQIRLSAGLPPMESVAKGLLLVHGTFLADRFIDLKSLDVSDETVSVALKASARRLTFDAAHLARILYQPLATEDAEHFRGKTGVLLVNRDFSESAVRTVRQGEVTVNSVLLGWHIHQTTSEVVCAVLRDPAPPTAAWVISTRDGSRLQAMSLRGEGDRLVITEPVLGSLAVEMQALVEIRAGARNQGGAAQGAER